MSRRIGLSLIVLAAILGLAWVPTATVTATAVDPVAADEVIECFADGCSAESLEAETWDLIAGVKPCRNCRDREWCTCTYPGGYTRISCDPCCYINYAGWITCLD